MNSFNNYLREKLSIDLKGCVGKDNSGYERVHGGDGHKVKNEMGDTVLDLNVMSL